MAAVCVFSQRESKLCLCLSQHLCLAAKQFLKHLGDEDLQGCATCQKGRLLSVGDAQCTSAYGNAEKVAGSASRPGAGCVLSFTRVVCCLGDTLAGAPWGLWMLQGKAVPVVVLLCTMLDSELCPVLAQCLRVEDFGLG